MRYNARVVNRETGQVIAGPGHPWLTAERVDAADLEHKLQPPRGCVWVLLRPSFREGMPYDLSSYPAGWVEEVTGDDRPR